MGYGVSFAARAGVHRHRCGRIARSRIRWQRRCSWSMLAAGSAGTNGRLPPHHLVPPGTPVPLIGVRAPPNAALARPGSCKGCPPGLWGFNGKATSCLVGGYVYRVGGWQPPKRGGRPE